MNELERYRNALERLARLGNGDKYGTSDGNMIAREALHPTPQYEDVEVKVWAEVSKITGKIRCSGVYGNKPQSIGQYCEIVELTGRFPREIKPKVMRREEIIISESERATAFYKAGIEYNGPTKFYAEWEE